MKKILLFVTCIVIAHTSFCQQFYFRQKLYGDSAALEKALPGPSQQVLTVYETVRKTTY